MNIKRVGNVILAVKDLDKSVEFYHNTMGLPIKNQRRTWVDLGQSGGALLSLHPASLTAKHLGTSLENGIVIGLVVGDIESALQELKAQKVTIYRDIESHKIGKNAIILDPDKYMISLFEPALPDSAKQASGFHGFAPL